MEIRNLSVRSSGAEPRLENLSLSINRGEIFGVGGVVGNGQRSLALLLAGKMKPAGGAILFDGADVSDRDIAARLALGIHWLPENPVEEALLRGKSTVGKFCPRAPTGKSVRGRRHSAKRSHSAIYKGSGPG